MKEIETMITTVAVKETVVRKITENGRTVASVEDRKQDRLARSMIIADAEIKKIIRNWGSKNKWLPCDRVRERKTVGM